MKSFIQDKERVLDSVSDLLKTSVYAEDLVKVIENTPKDRVFTIGLFGGWGTGKSSIIRTAQSQIEKKHKDIRFITYDAWKYANDSFRRMFLLKVQQELKMRQTEEMSRFYQSETAEAEPKTKISSKGLAVAVAVVTIISAILFLIPSVEIIWKMAFPTICTLGTFLIALINGCFYDLKVSISKPALFAPEQFESCFKEMMSKCLKQTNWFQRTLTIIKDYVEVGEASVVGLEKLIIVIDNIDRCPSDLAYQMLTDVKTFLSDEKYNLVFIVPVDDEALKKHLFRRWNKANDVEINKEKEEFLRKFFNVTLRIKPHQVTELLHFAHAINEENGLNFNNDTLSIVAKEFADNPRRIIQLLNNLSGDLALYENEFANKNETAICAALIIREEYPTFYKEVAKNLDLVRNYREDAIKIDDPKIKETLSAFMRVADVYLKQLPIESLQKIFTNTSSIFSDLPTDVQRAVTTYDVSKVMDFIVNNEGQKVNLVDFAIERLESEVKYGATTQTSMWIVFLSQLYKSDVFDSSRFGAIDAALSKYYGDAIPITNDLEALNYFGRKMNEAGYPSLRNSIVAYLNADNSQNDAGFEEVLYAYMGIFTSEQDCKDIAELVENYYVEHTINKDFPYTDNQIRILYGDSFVAKQVEGLSALGDDDRVEDILWCIKANKQLAGETYSTLFAKYIELFGNTRGKSKEQYIEFINNLHLLFAAIDTASLKDEPKQVYDIVVGARRIPNPSRPSQTQYDTQRSILDEVADEQAKAVTDFCYEIVRISGGNINVSAAINVLFTKCKYEVIEGALRANDLGIPINSLASILIKADDYSDDLDISIIEVLLTGNSNGGYMVNDAEVENKIHSLIDNATIKNAENLISRLVVDKQILRIVTEYVASLDSETINALPSTIAKYAISTFNRNTSESYKDNEDFLILVLKMGTASQKKEVVRLMKTKISLETDLDMVVNVLDNLVTEDQKMLRLLVGELEGIKDSEAVSDDVKRRVAALTEKLASFIKKPGVIGKLLGKK